MHLLDALLVGLTRLRQFTEESRQLAKESHKEGDCYEHDEQNPSELEGTSLGDVTVADCSHSDDGPVDSANVLC